MKPKHGENKEAFLARGMSESELIATFADEGQRREYVLLAWEEAVGDFFQSNGVEFDDPSLAEPWVTPEESKKTRVTVTVVTDGDKTVEKEIPDSQPRAKDGKWVTGNETPVAPGKPDGVPVEAPASEAVVTGAPSVTVVPEPIVESAEPIVAPVTSGEHRLIVAGIERWRRGRSVAIHTSKSNVNDKPPTRPSWLRMDSFDAAFAIEPSPQSVPGGSVSETLSPMEFQGYASVFGSVVDSWMPTVVERGAFKATLDRIAKEDDGFIPILWQHSWDRPIGQTVTMLEDNKGLFLKAKLDDIDFARDVAKQLKSRTVRKMSIGFESTAERFDKSLNEWVRYITGIDLWETSVVTFAADPNAWITEAAARYGATHDPRQAGPDSPLLALRRVLPLWQAQKAAGALDISDEERAVLVSIAGLVEGERNAFGRELEGLIAKRTSSATSRQDVISKLAARAGCATTTVDAIIGGDLRRLTLSRLKGFAAVLGSAEGVLYRAAERDGVELAAHAAPVKVGAVGAVSGKQRLRAAELDHFATIYGV